MIASLIQKPESKTLEFKRDLSSPRPWLKTLVAFANSAGGKLVFGVTDDRQIIGVENPLDQEERIANLIADSISPRLVPNIELTSLDGKTLLVVEVFLSGTRPHFIKADGIEKGTYVRLGSTNRQADIFDHIDIQDPLPKAVEEIMLFLKKHAMRGADFSGIRRKDIWSIPVNILREVVINALVHADYSHRGTPTRIAFYDNRIEVESPGLLLPGLTIEDIKQGVSQLRNPVIARVFRELELIEQWGSGIPGIFRQAKAEKLPEPTIEEIAGRIRFSVSLPEILPLTREQSRSGRLRRLESGLGSGAQSGAQSDRILFALTDSPLSTREIAIILDLETKSGALKRSVKQLLEEGIVEYTIPEKPNSRLQKYRLTAKGQSLINH